MLGTTGYGKSTLTRLILPKRDYSVFFATKRRDSTVDELERDGYVIQKTFRPETDNKIILKPAIDPDNNEKQANEFRRAMSEIFWSGGWCMVWDEAAYLQEELRLGRKMNTMLMQGRSLGISIITTTQRPAFIPVYAYDMATHFFFWKMKLHNDVLKVARLGGLDIGEMIGTIRALPKFEFLYYNKDSDVSVRCTPEVN